MSGTPTEAEIQAQWRASVDILETLRNLADGTLAGAGGKFDTLIQILEGEYTPSDLANAVNRYRAGCSALVEPGTALEFLTPIVFEYGRILAADATLGFGSGYRDIGALFSALYEWFVAKSLTVESRAITFDTTATAGVGNVGNGAMSRLYLDENTHEMEACHVEKKIFRCRADKNTGVEENAESFEFVGTTVSFDSLLRAAHGSGEAARTFIRSHHAGTGTGGSLLTNSSFSEYSASGTPKFTGWTESAGGAQLAQDTTNFYRTHPGAQTDASLKITGGGGDVTIKQALTDMRIRRLDPDTPYFLRIMLNKTIGTATGGTVVIRLGSVSVSVTILAMAPNWTELLIPPAQGSWARFFNENPFDIEIEWIGSASGFLLVDDILFAPFDLIDGTYWFLRGNAAVHVPWLIDDTLTFTDTGGAPATGKIQWWLFVSGLGYLPHTVGAPTFADP